MNVKDAKLIAFGSKKAVTLDEFWDAWQWLYDNNIELKESDLYFLDKLICDGAVTPREGYFENPPV